jgi:hypothetical protein
MPWTGYNVTTSYKQYVKQTGVLTSNSGPQFSSYYYRGDLIGDTCKSWTAFQKSSLSLPLDTMYFTSIQLHVYAFDLKRQVHAVDQVAVCADADAVTNIVKAWKSAVSEGSSAFAQTCNGHTWRVLNCGLGPSICADCTMANCSAPSCPNIVSSFAVNPCLLDSSSGSQLACHNNLVASFGIVNLRVGVRILYPLVYAVSVPFSAVHSTSLTLAVNVSKSGVVYCAAFQSGYVLLSSYAITQANNRVVSTSAGVVKLNITGLVSQVVYDLYCYTEDYQQHYMDIDAILSTKQTVTTRCCRRAYLATKYAEIKEYVSGTSSTASIFLVAVDALPTSGSSVTLSAQIVPFNCSISTYAFPTVAVFPSVTTFTSASLSLKTQFVIRGQPGCYNLTWISNSAIYNSTSAVGIKILSASTPPSPPLLVSAMFSDSSSQLLIGFDSSTNRAKSVINPATVFKCIQLFEFDGAWTSTCLWQTDSLVAATLLGNSTHPLRIAPSSASSTVYSVSLRPNVLMALCPSGLRCAFAAAQSVTVATAARPIVPVVSLSTSAVIGACDSISLDPTQSSGQAGRNWLSVSWTVSCSSTAAVNITAIESLLNTHYAFTTNKVVTVSNNLLTPGFVYSFTLTLTNFLGEYATQSASVTVSATKFVAQVRITGPMTVNTFRSNSLALFSLTSMPACADSTMGSGGSSSTSLLTVWKFYREGVIQNDIVSTSPDPAIYRLPGYNLDARVGYVVQVSITATQTQGSTTYTSASSASVVIRVGSQGVTAVIKGGSVRTVGMANSVTMDATGSYDIDYPVVSDSLNGQLYFAWTCTETSPDFGSVCAGQTSATNSSLFYLNTNASMAQQIFVAVIVTNAYGDSASDNTTVSILTAETPTISINPLTTKLNPATKLVLTGVLSGKYPLIANWNFTSASSSGIDLSSLALTPLSKATSSSVAGATFQLAIRANSLAAGLSYSLQMSCTYTTSINTVISTVSVTVNAPPVGGTVDIQPTNGTALDTMFVWNTAYWHDDPSDYPLMYYFSYYSPPGNIFQVAKYSSQSAYTTTMMGQGIASNNYIVACLVAASDIYNSSNTIRTQIIVSPPTTFYSDQISALLQPSQSGATASASATFTLVSAISTALNTVNCTLVGIASCAMLNREDCMLTAHTCGACNDGYIGENGDSNNPCVAPAIFVQQLNQTVPSCQDDSVCRPFSRMCDLASNKCVALPKSCPNACSGHGNCTYYNSFSGAELAYCSSYDTSCTAKCVCDVQSVNGTSVGSYFASDCSLTQAQLEENIGIREILCQAMWSSSSRQDVTTDVIASRAASVISMLLDDTQVSSTALVACTQLLVDTITDHADLVATAASSGSSGSGSDVATECIDALSLALQRGPFLPTDLVNNVTKAMSILSTELENTLVVGESAMAIISDNVQISSQLMDVSFLTLSDDDDGNASVFAPPLTTMQQLTDTVTATIGVALAGVDDGGHGDVSSVGISVVHYTGNVHNTSAHTSTSIGLSLNVYVDEISTSSQRRRKLQSGLGEMSVVVTLPNNVPIDYTTGDISTENRTHTCTETTQAYNVTLECSHNRSYPYVCNVSKTDTTVPYVCPSVTVKPMCSTWDGSDFVKNPLCTLVSFTAANTICRCYSGYDTYVAAASTSSSQSITRSRKLSSTSTDPALTQFGGVAEAVGDNFVHTLDSIQDISAADIIHNSLLFGILVALLVVFFVGFGIVVTVDYKEIDAYKEMKITTKHSKTGALSFDELLSNAIPSDLSPHVSWYQRLWKLLQVQHDAVGLFSPYNEEGDYRTTRWLKVVGLILNFLFINTILAVQYFDDNSCIARVSEPACVTGKSLDQTNTMCIWNSGSSKCQINADASESPLAVMVAASATTILAIPLQVLFTVMVGQARKYIQSVLTKAAVVKKRAASELHLDTQVVTTDMDTISSVKRTKRAIIFRAARLKKMQALIDDVSLEDEVNSLKRYLQLEQSVSDKHELDSYFSSSKPRHRQHIRAKPTMHTRQRAGRSVQAGSSHAALGRQRETEYSYSSLTFANMLSDYYHRLMFSFKRVSHLLSGEISVPSLTRSIRKARSGCEKMCAKMSRMPNDTERSEYLLRKFTLHVLSEYHQSIAGRFFAVFVKGAVDGEIDSSRFSFLCVCLLPCYLVFESLYIFLFGVSIGPRATRAWLVNVCVTFLHSLLIIRPITIWAKALSLSSIVRVDISTLYDHLSTISRIVLNRQVGYMKYANCRIQHVNVACRAARHFPRLTVSRFLMSLTDFDFPGILQPSQQRSKTKREMMFECVFVLIFICIGLMPEALQDVCIEGFTSGVTNVIILAIVLFGAINLTYLIALLVFIVCGIALVVFTYVNHLKQSRVIPSMDIPSATIISVKSESGDSNGAITVGPASPNAVEVVMRRDGNSGTSILLTDSLDKYIATEERKWKGGSPDVSGKQSRAHYRSAKSVSFGGNEDHKDEPVMDADLYPDQDDYFDPDRQDTDSVNFELCG